MAAIDDDLPVPLPIGDTLDLHSFRPGDVGSLVPEWLTVCREAGITEVRIIHGKGSGTLRAGVHALLERSPLVRGLRSDGNWGGVAVSLWGVATDEARVRAIVRASPRLLSLLQAVQAVGPPGAWVGAGALRNRVWHTLHRLPGEPADDDVDVAWHGAGDPAEDARLASLLGAALAAPWDVGDQARYGATSAERGMATWPETATGVAVRLAGGELELFAAHGWADLVGMVVRPIPGLPVEVWRARLAEKRWRQRFPWARIEPA